MTAIAAAKRQRCGNKDGTLLAGQALGWRLFFSRTSTRLPDPTRLRGASPDFDMFNIEQIQCNHGR
jgi:hypothetical protein